MKIKLVWHQPRRVEDPLYVEVDPGAVLDAPDDWAAGALPQVWFWEAADEKSRALAAEHPEWWDHPYVAELALNGTKVATRPKAKAATPPVQVDTSK